MTRQFKIIVEKHSDGYVAYPLGMKGIVVGEGDSYEEALADVKSAIRFHIETFGDEVLPNDSPRSRHLFRRQRSPPEGLRLRLSQNGV
jgi:predicted RNase H-like HicB family nuclease